MSHAILWSRPVFIELSPGKRRMVDGPLSALECLNSEWPVRNGRYLEEAISMCHAALERMRSAEEAREVFLSATIEAAVGVRGARWNRSYLDYIPAGAFLETTRQV